MRPLGTFIASAALALLLIALPLEGGQQPNSNNKNPKGKSPPKGQSHAKGHTPPKGQAHAKGAQAKKHGDPKHAKAKRKSNPQGITQTTRTTPPPAANRPVVGSGPTYTPSAFANSPRNVPISSVGSGRAIPNAHLHHALFELEAARSEISRLPAGGQIGAQKQLASKEIGAAIHEIKSILKFLDGNTSPVATRGDRAALNKNNTRFPHLHHALVELKHAEKSLRADPNSYGGHKITALRDIQAAHQQIRSLINLANRRFELLAAGPAR